MSGYILLPNMRHLPVNPHPRWLLNTARLQFIPDRLPATGNSSGHQCRVKLRTDDPGIECHTGQYDARSAACVRCDRKIEEIQAAEPRESSCPTILRES